uniref:UBC core domain-containing protein n=1 Tax=Bubo bubo TaxID=30461 RepID=A0A8C0EEB5_BUBBB
EKLISSARISAAFPQLTQLSLASQLAADRWKVMFAVIAHQYLVHQAHIKFPIDYPYSPPTFRFLTKMWHPNIYENGDVCISILHPPVDDPQSGELPSERWNPTQNVRTILLSVISLLNEPNTFSPANVDASVMFRKWRDSKGKDKEYAEIISPLFWSF